MPGNVIVARGGDWTAPKAVMEMSSASFGDDAKVFLRKMRP